MIRYRVVIQPEHRERLAHLPPSIKRKLHASLRLLEMNPWTGKPLREELVGYRSYPIHPYRVIYRVESSGRLVRLVMVELRREVYDLLLHQLPHLRDRVRRRKRHAYRRLSGAASLLR